MKGNKTTIALVTLLLVLLSSFTVGGKQNNLENFDLSIPISMGSDFTHPCEIIDLEVIKKVFEVADKDIVADNPDRTYPTCRYKWKGHRFKRDHYFKTLNRTTE